jgi:hypothetical protein
VDHESVLSQLFLKTKETLERASLCSQGVELLDGGPVASGPLFHLALVNHVNGFNTAQSNPSTPERFESQRRPDLLFNETVVLFNNVVKVFTFSDFNAFIVFLVIAFNPRFVDPALININLGRHVMGLDRSIGL